jgi:hypothetical protein
MTKTSDTDALFALPLSEFTTARNSLASRLKKEGRTHEAERVKATPKPSATAWAVNQLFWQQPKEFERLLTIGERARKAQAGKPADLRVLLDEQRGMISDLTDRAAEILEKAGHSPSPDARRRIATTLGSLAAWGHASAETQAGRLTSDLEPLGFDGLAALLDGKKLEPAKVLQFRRLTQEKKSAEDTAAARAKANEAVKAAEKALTVARREAERAEAARAKASTHAETLETQKQELDARCSKAKEAARAAAGEAKKAAQAVDEAERALVRARAALE